MSGLRVVILTPPGLTDPSLAIAGSRAGGLGVLDLEYGAQTLAARQAWTKLCRFSRKDIGLKLCSQDIKFLQDIIPFPGNLRVVILTHPEAAPLEQAIKLLRPFNIHTFLECTSLEEAQWGERAGVDGVIAKGHEAGGRIGNETTFILLQRCLRNLHIPIWVQGGIGLHTATACYATGAQGVILDSQILLTRESPLPEAVKAKIRSMDGTETVVLGEDLGEAYRVCGPLGRPVIKDLQAAASSLMRETRPAPEKVLAWRQAVAQRMGWSSPDIHLLPGGQDLGFASTLAGRFETVGGIVEGIRQAIEASCRTAATHCPLVEGSPLARSHNTRFPIVQGPMARVSDNADFVFRVSQAGALPFVAAAWMQAQELEGVLKETQARLQDQAWGVGLLGFLPREVYADQVEVVRRYHPPYALIAGGQPHQVKQLEQQGIATYVHVPSPGLLRMFLSEGLNRFVFEGRESGGHVGPLCSFVLFEEAINILAEFLAATKRRQEYHVLFAGGIHDALSAAMIAVMSAALVEQGVRVGVQLGTAYLFADEAVASGAIVKTYQQEALNCNTTTLLVSSPGHAERVVETSFAQVFKREKWLQTESGAMPEEVRNTLDGIKLGRLRIATKGLARNPDYRHDPHAPKFINLSEAEQREQGVYLVGQLAAIREQVCSIESIHLDISVQGGARVNEIWQKYRKTSWHPDEAQPSDIAIIGMACLFPKAPNLQVYWQNILNKVNAISEIPPERWDWKLYYDPDLHARDKICSKWGAFLEEIPFDPTQYGMPPKSLPSVEPLQLLTLEVANQALKDAGYAHRPFPRNRTSVILGISGAGELGHLYNFRTSLPLFFGDGSRDIITHFEKILPEWTEDSFPGILMNVAAGRIANRLDLGGINCTVDAACGSSLAALYWAVRELESGHSDMVIVGSGDSMQDPFTFMCFAKTQALSPRGQCQALDERADGIVLGEGVAGLILKRLADAERDGDQIYAVIKGVGASSDGRDKSLTAPRPEGQVKALERAYAKAGVSPATVELIEAHATGTTIGDRTEIESLNQVFREAEAPACGCAVGSVKSMIGHTKSSAGLASTIKTVLALHHKVLPPTLGVDNPIEILRRPDTPFYVNTETRPWNPPAPESPRRAGVSAFGFGGTNFHVVLEEYTGNYLGNHCHPSFKEWPAELLLWEKPSRRELLETIRPLEEALIQGMQPSLGDLAFTLSQEVAGNSTKKGGANVRLAVIASSRQDLQTKLAKARAALSGSQSAISDSSGIYFTEQPLGTEGKVAFLFPGQGSQYVNMLSDLAIQFPEIRSLFERSDRILAGKLTRPLSSFIYPPSSFSESEQLETKQALAQTQVAQPAIGTADLAMFHLLTTLGIHPDMMAGHSYGEYVALCAAGVLREEDLITLSEARARFILEGVDQDAGCMAAINADLDSVSRGLEGLSGVWIANVNAPKQVVISGTRDGIQEAIQKFSDQGIEGQPIRVSCAFHSPLMAVAEARLREFLASLDLGMPRVNVFSNTTSAIYPTDSDDVVQLLVKHLTSRVQFVSEIEAMYETGARIFIEVGPGRVLSGLVGQILGERPHLTVISNQAGRSGLVQLQHMLGQLKVHGVPLRLEKILQRRSLQKIDLKTMDQGPTIPSSTWMVNGARARPIAERVPLERTALAPLRIADPGEKMLKTSIPYREKTRPTHEAGQQSELQKAAVDIRFPEAPLRTFSDEGSAAVMVQYQQLMQRFLESQKRVMMSYLQGSAAETGILRSGARDAFEQPATVEASPMSELREEIPAVPQILAREGEAASSGLTGGASASAGTPPSHPARAFPCEELSSCLLQIVSERTGYPAENLDLNLDMEADLGIDSIKRTEILGHFLARVSPVSQGEPSLEMEGLNRIKTLGGILDYMAALGKPLIEGAGSSHAGRAQATEPADKGEPEGALPRFTLKTVEVSPLKRTIHLDPKKVILVTDDGQGVAQAFVKKLKARGLNFAMLRFGEGGSDGENLYNVLSWSKETIAGLLETIRQEHGPFGGLIHLFPLRTWTPYGDLSLADWRENTQLEVKTLFHLLQLLEPDLKDAAASGSACVLSAIGLGGSFAHDPTAGQREFFPGHGAISGLLKTVAVEWTDLLVKIVDLSLQEPPDALADHLIAEMEADDGLTEVGYEGRRRLTLGLVEAPLAERAGNVLIMDSSWVILVTGGARGITSEVARELARRYRPTLILAGSSPLPPEIEGPETAGLVDPQALKRALIDTQERRGQLINLAEVEAAYRQLLKDREIRSNIAAVRDFGARVKYFQVDVRDEPQFGGLIDDLYHTYGRLDGVVHGAGIIEDRLLKDKTWESFYRVFGTKTESAFILSRRLRPETLKFLALFSSIAGRFGNRGQGDYTAANEVINKLAVYLDARWPGRVVSINWGPWDKIGMVSPEIKRQFAARGVGLVPPEAGAAIFDLEMQKGRKGEAEVVVGNGFWREAAISPSPCQSAAQLPLLQNLAFVQRTNSLLEMVKSLDTAQDLYLQDHRLDGKPVLPAAMAIELMAEAAQMGCQDWKVVGAKDIRVFKGIILENNHGNIRLSVCLNGNMSSAPDTIGLAVDITDVERPEIKLYRADIIMSRNQSASGPQQLLPEMDLKKFPISARESYARFLFHGPRFQSIQRIEGISKQGILATIAPSTPDKCLAGKPLGNWLLDPVVLDCGPQLAIIWARHYHDITLLPSSFKAVHLYRPFPASSLIRCYLQCLEGSGNTSIFANVYYMDQEGKFLGMIEGLESTGSKSLNRLSGKQNPAQESDRIPGE